jgi:hypothetical protein
MSRLPPATVQGRFAILPVAPGGALDPTTGRGSISLEGGVEFRAGGRRLALTELALDTTRHTLSGKIGGRMLTIASTIGFKNTRDGFGSSVGIKALKLRRTAAKILNRKLGLGRVFRSGRSFAEATSSTQPGSVTVLGGSAVLAGDEATFAKLKSLEVEATPFEAAKVLGSNPPTFGFPLLPSGAAVPLDLSSGGVGSETGLRLIRQGGSSPPAELSLIGLSVSLESKLVSADTSIETSSSGPRRFGVTPIATLDTAGASTSLDPGARIVTLTGAGAKINQFLAERLDEVFAKPKEKAPFAAGEPLGTVTVTVQAP